MTSKAALTQRRILDSAEKLFAEYGFNRTSLRAITDLADVNLAAVNYHFGSKNALVRAVFARYLHRFFPLLEHQLTVCIQRAYPLTLEAIFSAFIPPLLALEQQHKQGAQRFMCLLSHGYFETQGHLRTFITRDYGDALALLRQAVRKALPELSDADYFWRMHFTLGSVIFTMASSDTLRDIARADFNTHIDIEQLMREIIPFIAAGVATPCYQPSMALQVNQD